MRSRLLPLFAVCLFFGAVDAHAANADKGLSYGNATCASNIPCPTRDDDPTPFINQATSCVSRQFGYSPSIFDDVQSLDYNLCMSTHKSQTFGTGVVPLSPRCCFHKTSPETCELTCESLTAK